MRWNKGYTATYYMTRVDPVTWRDLDVIEITDGQVRREDDGLRDSADVSCTEWAYDTEEYVRIYLDAKQEGSSAHVPLFTGLATSPATDHEGSRSEHSIECYSVLKAAEDVGLLRGWYAPAGIDGATIVKQLLAASPAPIDIAEAAPRLTTSIIAEDGETHLTMAEKVLRAIGWRMTITGDGRVQIKPPSDEPVAHFDPREFDVIETHIKVSADWFDCPNVFVAIADDMTAIARDDRGKSPLSVANRGREVWRQDTSADVTDSESIEAYAQRMLAEAQSVRREVSYDRRYVPEVFPSDVVRMSYPEQGIEGLFRVESQSITLGYAGRTAETLKEV